MYPHQVPWHIDQAWPKRHCYPGLRILSDDIVQRESLTPFPMAMARGDRSSPRDQPQWGGPCPEELGVWLAMLWASSLLWLLAISWALFSHFPVDLEIPGSQSWVSVVCTQHTYLHLHDTNCSRWANTLPFKWITIHKGRNAALHPSVIPTKCLPVWVDQVCRWSSDCQIELGWDPGSVTYGIWGFEKSFNHYGP